MLNLVLVIGITGLLSYGLEFELENGQFNLLAFSFCLLAIYIFRRYPKARFFSYILISVATQLKFWPGIFMLMLVDDWRDWRANIKRGTGLALLNLAGLFVLGPRYLLGFAQNFVNAREDYFWVGNPSINSYLALQGNISPWVRSNFWALQTILLVVVLGCIAAIIFAAARRRKRGFNRHLFFACALGGMLIPSFSYDFKLPMLVAPLILFLDQPEISSRLGKRSLTSAIFLVLALAYAAMTFPSGSKPVALQNNFPILFFMLLLVTASYLVSVDSSEIIVSKKMRKTKRVSAN